MAVRPATTTTRAGFHEPLAVRTIQLDAHVPAPFSASRHAAARLAVTSTGTRLRGVTTTCGGIGVGLRTGGSTPAAT